MIASGALRIPLQNPGPFLLSMCSGFAVNTLALLVISLASALTLKVGPWDLPPAPAHATSTPSGPLPACGQHLAYARANLQVLGMCKDVALVLVGVAFYGDQVGASCVVGGVGERRPAAGGGVKQG
jgi:hypothetical protein